ncbi:GrpB family protein [Microbacterium gorillae]|uniref:GrpB family protein n=1 Tax=Microbacterium gorillae TaxID=1231063 RepID=UPI000693C7E1|nr:GrpB family protein [Microbacterium gorillae]
MPTPEQIIAVLEDTPPPGLSPWVVAPERGVPVTVVAPDPTWPEQYRQVAARIRDVLGARVLRVDHVGSTAVPGLAAKPVIDVDLTVARPEREADWLPALHAAGFELRVREPWWHEHRMLRGSDPAVNLHVFGPDSPETYKHLVLRDHLRRDEADRLLYAEAKRSAATESTAAGELVMEYNARKEPVLREILGRAFTAAGLLP